MEMTQINTLNTNESLTGKEFYYKLKLAGCSRSKSWSLAECEDIVPLVNEINQLKREKDAVILAHSYCGPEVVYGVADFCSDSYALGLEAKNRKESTIIFAGVRFMAETAKITCPDKTVFLPEYEATCSLAESLTGEQLVELKKRYPGYTVVCYINSSVEVKAHSDVCVTSSNVYHIVENLESDKILFVPDSIMAQNIRLHLAQKGIDKEIVSTDGTCYVHEKFEAHDITDVKAEYSNLKVLSHPECTTDVTQNSDFVGSTGAMMKYIEEQQADNYLMLTECGLVNRMQIENPQKNFLNGCQICKYMNMNTLMNIKQCLV
jgi:quinolinate synthase